MCQLLGMNCATPTDFTFSFKGLCLRGGCTDKHEHGWGLAVYENRGLRTFHDPLPAAESKIAKFLSTHPLKTLNMMAHIRYATQGDVSLENVHPFSRELWGINWSFVHNGDIPKYTINSIKSCVNMAGDKCDDERIERRRPHWLGRTPYNPRNVIYHPVGDTDSEAVFCAILNGLRSEYVELPTLPVLYETIQRFCAEIVSGMEDSTILNFLLGCGQYTQFAYSWPGSRPGSSVWNGLYYTIRRPPFNNTQLTDIDYSVDFDRVTTPNDRVAVIATKPLTVNEEWNEFKRGQLLMFDNGWAYSELYDCYEVEQRGHGLCSNAVPKMIDEHNGMDSNKVEIDGRISTRLQKYDTPTTLRALVDEVVSANNDDAHGETKQELCWATKGVDLGCGSGCAGLAFRSCIQHLTGVDISPEMVDRAKERGCYERLLIGDIECVLAKKNLEQNEEKDEPIVSPTLDQNLYDLIFACNVFAFVRDMRGVFQSVKRSLKSRNGIFAFSIEFIDLVKDTTTTATERLNNGIEKEDRYRCEDKRYVLQSCARYAHNRKYIESLFEEFGFETKVVKASNIRKHEGIVVQGTLMVLTMPAVSSTKICVE